MTSTNESSLVAPLLRNAQTLLETMFREPVSLHDPQILDSTRSRNLVLRCATQSAAPLPVTVIIKSVRGEEVADYDPETTKQETPAWRLLNEWSGSLFLQQMHPDPPLSAHVYGADRATGVIALEDLGPGDCLGYRLMGGDAGRAQQALRLYGATLGHVHSAGIGRQNEFRRLRRTLAGRPVGASAAGRKALLPALKRFRALCAALDISLTSGFDAEIQAVVDAVAVPGPYLTFVPGDICLQNHVIADDRMRLFDLEFCGFRHALLDAAYLCLPFPTCSTVNRIPEEVVERALTDYRVELAKRCVAAEDETAFREALLLAHAWWTIGTFGWWDAVEALKSDASWGLASLRQRHLQRSEALAVAADRIGRLPEVGKVMRTLAGRLRETWPPQEEMPLYPAFRSPKVP